MSDTDEPKPKSGRGGRRDGAGRPDVVIDVRVMAEAAAIGCTMVEIAAMLGICVSALQNHLKRDPQLQEQLDAAKERGRSSLRRLQWKRAVAGSDTMLIWLGKQFLGQRDKWPDEEDADRTPMRVIVELVGDPAPNVRVEAPRARPGLRLIDADAVEFKG